MFLFKQLSGTLVLVLATLVQSLPTHFEHLEQRQTNYSNDATLNFIDGSVAAGTNGLLLTQAVLNQVALELQALQPTATPSSIPQAVSTISKLLEVFPTTAPQQVKYVEQLILNGLHGKDLKTLLQSQSDDSSNNTNPINPSPPIFPSASLDDAPYSQNEADLRKLIYIPDTFTYGKKRPMILCPGSATKGGQVYAGNFRKLLAGRDDADMVWLNPEHSLLDDAQANSEMVAYAIHYISAISKRTDITMVGFSQGNINIHWALKYWPSTRKLVSNYIGVSPDFHGTTIAPAFCFPANPCPPALIQQGYEAAYIKALRSDDGDSAYVPSTVIYSGMLDEIVEPQQGADASGALNDVRNVGVTNAEIQVVCPNVGTGIVTTHEAALAHPLVFELAKDALENGGPGRVDRIDLAKACAGPVAEGMGLPDFLATEALIPVAVSNLLFYQAKTLYEPALMAYAKVNPL